MILPAANFRFSWSLRRRHYWQSCRRSYFYYYYAAQGGHDTEFANSQCRQLHEFKNRFSLAQYVNILLDSALRNIFYQRFEEEDEATPTATLTDFAIKKMWRDFNAMLNGEFKRDHRQLMLQEFFLPNITPRELAMELTKRINDSGNRLENGIWQELNQIPFVQRRWVETPQAVNLNELECYCVPLVAFKIERELWIIENFQYSFGENELVTLHKFYAMNQHRCPPDAVRSFSINRTTGELYELGKNLNISSAIKEIMRDVDEMQKAIRPDGTLHEDDFAPNQKFCPFCKFQPYCQSNLM